MDFGLFGHVALNIGADGPSEVAGQQAGDNDMAWYLGGYAKLGKIKANRWLVITEGKGAASD